MASITLQVSFDPESYEFLSQDPAIDMGQMRRIFTIEDLSPLQLVPGPDDLVLDERLHPAAWLVQQRSLRFDGESNCTIGLLVGIAPEQQVEFLKTPRAVHLTADAQAAIFSEYVGRPSAPSPDQLLFMALHAHRDVRVGDVLQQAGFSRHHFYVKQRAFVWSATGAVQLRFLLDLGMRPAEKEALGLESMGGPGDEPLTKEQLKELLGLLREWRQVRDAGQNGGSD